MPRLVSDAIDILFGYSNGMFAPATLRATIQNMATPTTATSSLADTTGYHTELQKVQEELKVVKTEGDRWQTLATVSFICGKSEIRTCSHEHRKP
jgi:hypothetical protein